MKQLTSDPLKYPKPQPFTEEWLFLCGDGEEIQRDEYKDSRLQLPKPEGPSA